MKISVCLILLLLCCNSPTFAKKKIKRHDVRPGKEEPMPVMPEDPFAVSDRITLFEHIVTVKADGVLHVVEHITIYNGNGVEKPLADIPPDFEAAGGRNDEIQRGIMRTFPTVYVNRYHLFQNTTFELLDVKMNDSAVPYKMENSAGSNGYILKIGDPDRRLSNGFYTYSIIYETRHQVKFLDDYDELYWNVTGNGWGFRIDSAVCTFIIPGNDTVFSNACYTGAQGEQAQNCSVLQRSTDTVRFATTKALWPGQGLSVATSWRKGLVKAPDKINEALWMFKNNIGALGMPILLVLILCYNFIQWWRKGRDLRPGTIYPRYEPPAGLSPAALGYIYFQQVKDKLIAATITDLALRHFFSVKVEKTGLIFKDTTYSFFKSDKEFVPAGYNDYHNEANGLLHTTIQKGTYNKSLAELMESMKDDLNRNYRRSSRKTTKGFFFSNSRYLALGFLLAIPAFVILAILNGMKAAINPWPFVPLIIAFILIMIVQYIFFKLLPAYTAEGRKLMDEIEGYRMYLKTVDEQRLNTMNPPERPWIFLRKTWLMLLRSIVISNGVISLKTLLLQL